MPWLCLCDGVTELEQIADAEINRLKGLVSDPSSLPLLFSDSSGRAEQLTGAPAGLLPLVRPLCCRCGVSDGDAAEHQLHPQPVLRCGQPL